MPVIQMKVISSKVDPAKVPMEALLAAQKEFIAWGKRFQDIYKKTVASWKKKPVFDIQIQLDTNAWTLTVFTENNIYRFLHDGTSERWALMSDDFVPKTVPRLLGSNPGAGVAVFKGKKQMQAHGLEAQKGIDAREWTQEIIKQEEKRFIESIEKAFLSVI